MHGGSVPRDSAPYHFHALRNERFAFGGKLFGRVPPGFSVPAGKEGKWT